MSCEEWFEPISAGVDGELDGREAAAVMDHLASCAACRELETTLAGFRRRSALHVAEAVPDRTDAILAGVSASRSGNRALLVRAAAVAVVVLGAWATVHATTDPAPQPPTTRVASATVMAGMDHFNDQEVHVTPGTTVNWRNPSTNRHQLVVDVNGATVQNPLAPGQTDSVTFDEPGTYTYRCTVHEGMTGTVVVES